MSKNASSADNQQGSFHQKLMDNPSETTRRAPFSDRIIKAYLLGALHDGTLNKGKRFRFSQKGNEWLKLLQTLFKKIGYNSWLYREGKKRDVYVLETLADFLEIRFNPNNLIRKEEKNTYVKGFFDAEGGIPHERKSRFYIQLSQNNRNKLRKIKIILRNSSINTGKIHNPSSSINPKYWRMYISADSQWDFIRKIGSWHPRKLAIIRKRVMI